MGRDGKGEKREGSVPRQLIFGCDNPGLRKKNLDPALKRKTHTLNGVMDDIIVTCQISS